MFYRQHRTPDKLANVYMDVSNKLKHVIIHIITATRILFTKYWKRMEVLTKEELRGKAFETVEIDIITDIKRPK